MDGSADDVIEALERFCAGVADRDADEVMRTVGSAADLVVVTSEEPLLRGHEELRRFLDVYVGGPTTYSWEWDRYDVSRSGRTAWILAEGTETAVTGDHEERHAYRMTMVLEHREDCWVVRQVHGSSPH